MKAPIHRHLAQQVQTSHSHNRHLLTCRLIYTESDAETRREIIQCWRSPSREIPSNAVFVSHLQTNSCPLNVGALCTPRTKPKNPKSAHTPAKPKAVACTAVHGLCVDLHARRPLEWRCRPSEESAKSNPPESKIVLEMIPRVYRFYSR